VDEVLSTHNLAILIAAFIVRVVAAGLEGQRLTQPAQLIRVRHDDVQAAVDHITVGC
jgi:hypothetical protein